ncbi:restriction endonuclease subunit S [Desulfonema magnum]|uniref:restriction endonuclease subunit S n=1 Tax=Desulfonema magnum TaxID=45655 RepID=UPI001A9BC9F0|nr:restriction endonuclease subunit S [Desulfonema magnum]
MNNFKQLTTTPQNAEQLKKLVLQLAVQGKLTEEWRKQHPDVEPASALLERIRTEKERLIKEKKIKRQKSLPEITEEEKPFELPKEWEWCRLGKYALNRDGERIPLSKKDRELRQGEYDYYGASGVIDKIDDFLYEGEFLLIGEDGANLVARSTPIAFIAKGKFWVNNHAHILECIKETSIAYLTSFFNAIDLKPFITGGFQPKLSQGNLNKIPIAIPNFLEQKAIVEKVESLFAKIDRLHELAQKKAETRQKAASAVFGGINNATNEEDLQATWQLLKKNFSQVSQTREGVKQLRQSILQLAVQGRLTVNWRKQNPDVEPASELLGRIRAEKERLIKEKKIKRQKPLPEITEEEKLFDLPVGWEWCRIGKLCDMIYGSSLTKSQCIPNGKYPVYGSNGIVGHYNEYLTEKRAIIVGRKGSSGALNISEYPSWTTDVAYYIEESDNIDFTFFYYLLKSLNLEKMGKGIKPGLNRNEFYEVIAVLPPLPEQQAIVKKVNQLMSWCDELEKKIEERETLHEKIMHAVVKQAI